jgi:hypothetical protein
MATVLTAGIVALYAAFLAGENLPLVSGARVLAGLILVVGLVACAVGSTAMTTGASAGPQVQAENLGTAGRKPQAHRE